MNAIMASVAGNAAKLFSIINAYNEARVRVTAEMVRQCPVEDDWWSLGNAVLYDLCRVHPHHTSVHEVVAKVWSPASVVHRRFSCNRGAPDPEVSRGGDANPGRCTDDVVYSSVHLRRA